MTERSVFYTSNSHSDIFPNNTRGSFDSHIDENEFDYLDSKRLSVAIKNVTFENKFNAVTSRFGYPNMIIIQDMFDITPPDRAHKLVPLWRYQGLYATPSEIKTDSGLDYYLFHKSSNNQNNLYGEGQNFGLRNFTDIKIVSANFHSWIGSKTADRPPQRSLSSIIVHNIYFHESSYKTPKEFIDYLNYVFTNIEFDVGFSPISLDLNLFSLVGDRVLLHLKEKYNMHIFLSDELRKILGFKIQDLKSEDSYNLRELIIDNFKDKEKMSVFYPFNEPAHSYSVIPSDEFSIERITSNEQANTILDMDFRDTEMYFNTNIKLINKFPHFGFVQASQDINLSECATGIVGLRTSLKEPDIFRNGLYDTQVEFFNVKDHEEGIQICEIKSPSFFTTTIEKLADAKFELIDIDTNLPANFTLGTPTHIQVISKSSPTMSQRFNIFLDSSDVYSKSFYPSNTAHDFTVRLPEHLEFSKDWEVALKHIFIGNDLFNIYNDSCWMEFKILRAPPTPGKPTDMPDWSKFRGGVKHFEKYLNVPGNELEDVIQLKRKLRFEDIRLKTVQDLCLYIQQQFDKLGLKLEIGLTKGRVYIENKETEKYKLTEFKITMSAYLCNILGFVRGTNKSHKLRFEESKQFVATYRPNIALLVPTNFIVLCDIVSESIFGAKSVNILKLLSTNFDPNKEIIDLSFYQDEFIDLNLKEFSSIRIQVVDTTGNLIKSGKSYPTRCQLQFAKKV